MVSLDSCGIDVHPDSPLDQSTHGQTAMIRVCEGDGNSSALALAAKWLCGSVGENDQRFLKLASERRDNVVVFGAQQYVSSGLV